MTDEEVLVELEEAEKELWRDWIKEQKQQQKGKPWPRWMFPASQRLLTRRG